MYSEELLSGAPRSSKRMACPQCGASTVQRKNLARKAGGTIGCLAGATVCATAAIGGAETGATLGLVAGPPGAIVGSVAGAIIGALVGAAAGCTSGSSLGSVLDKHVLSNCECMTCGARFDEADEVPVPNSQNGTGVPLPTNRGDS